MAVVGRWGRKSGRRAVEAAAISRQLSRGTEGGGGGGIRSESAEMVEREDMGREISVGFFMHGETPASQPQHEFGSSMVCRFHPALRLVYPIRSAPLQWHPQEALRGDVIRTDRSMMLARRSLQEEVSFHALSDSIRQGSDFPNRRSENLGSNML